MGVRVGVLALRASPRLAVEDVLKLLDGGDVCSLALESLTEALRLKLSQKSSADLGRPGLGTVLPGLVPPAHLLHILAQFHVRVHGLASLLAILGHGLR